MSVDDTSGPIDLPVHDGDNDALFPGPYADPYPETEAYLLPPDAYSDIDRERPDGYENTSILPPAAF